MRMLFKVTEADRRLRKAPLAFQPFPFLWAEPHHAGVSLSCNTRSWQSGFSNSRSRITVWVARFPLWKRSWRTVSVALLYYKRVCLLYSIFKERLAKAQKGFHIEKAVQGRKEGDFNKSCPTVSLILLLVLNQHQSPKSF